MQSSVTFFRQGLNYLGRYLGHAVCKEGMRPIESKVAGIKKLTRLTNVTAVVSFSGMVHILLYKQVIHLLLKYCSIVFNSGNKP